MTKQKQAEQEEALETLRRYLPAGSKVLTIIRTVAKSGMSRTLDVYTLSRPQNGEEPSMVYLSGWVAKALGWTRTKEGWVRVDGCGMDAGFHLTHCLSYGLHGPSQGVPETGDYNDPVYNRKRSDAQHRPTPECYVAGYSLKNEWL